MKLPSKKLGISISLRFLLAMLDDHAPDSFASSSFLLAFLPLRGNKVDFPPDDARGGGLRGAVARGGARRGEASDPALASSAARSRQPAG